MKLVFIFTKGVPLNIFEIFYDLIEDLHSIAYSFCEVTKLLQSHGVMQQF